MSQTGLEGVALDVGTLLSAAVTLLVAYLLAQLLAVVLTNVAERAGSRRIAVKTLSPISKFLVYGVAVYTVAGLVLDLTSTQVLALSGLAGAAIGFGLKDLFAELVGGVVLVLERPYQVGDKVEIAGRYGEVTDIGLRSTTLVTPDDSEVAVPNDALFTGSLSNANAGNAEMQVVVDLHVATDADHEQAAAIVEEACLTSQYLYLTETRPVTVLVEDGPFYRTIRGKAYVNDLRDEFLFESDVTRRALDAFEERDIETPDVRVVDRDV
ncbi:mechanosensitive ion channel family protein [Halorarius litoreus]|uniref:mechanosensitive ion channel family protein n=1 Tax=Halorarius litoreus TaxID=2962676 RepID=UPI0020CF77C4|nr:mechanosensitive ion channel family protein [Halorarius litoreus]